MSKAGAARAPIATVVTHAQPGLVVHGAALRPRRGGRVVRAGGQAGAAAVRQPAGDRGGRSGCRGARRGSPRPRVLASWAGRQLPNVPVAGRASAFHRHARRRGCARGAWHPLRPGAGLRRICSEIARAAGIGHVGAAAALAGGMPSCGPSAERAWAPRPGPSSAGGPGPAAGAEASELPRSGAAPGTTAGAAGSVGPAPGAGGGHAGRSRRAAAEVRAGAAEVAGGR